MLQAIRTNVFETASSAIHSLVIATGEVPTPVDDEFVAGYAEYGRWRDTCATPEERLTYFWQAIIDIEEEDAQDEWEARIRKWMPNAVLPRYDKGDYNRGVSEAGALRPVMDLFEEHPEMLGCYLLGNDSVVECGSDEEEWDFPLPASPYWCYET